MIDFPTAFLAWLAATWIPAFIGLLVITFAGSRIQPKYTVAFAFGIFFWFFVDTIGGSATLDVNSGFGGGFAQLGVVLLFIFGVLSLFTFDRKRDILSPQSAFGKFGLAIPFLVAIAVGIHGLGEGVAFGSTAFSTTSTSLLDAFGGLTAGVAYFLHKGLEPMMIGACYNMYFNRQGVAWTRSIRNLVLFSLVFVVTSVVGAGVGYFLPSLDTTYFFALGTGTSAYAAFRLAGPLFVTSGNVPSTSSTKIAVAWVLGLLALYVSALFHS